MERIYQIYKEIANEYKLSLTDAKKLWKIIAPICSHEEFIKRCKAPFFHHDAITLGEHIIRDTVLAYKVSKKLKENPAYNKMIRLNVVVYIAMFHDLYEEPWQNNHKNKRFCNLHGFTHPIEAITNAITWYPEYFKQKDQSLMIIDGVLHHMYPLMVRNIDNKPLELNNQDKFDALDERFKKMIKASTNYGKFFDFSFRRTFFVEGRILSRVDKMVALKKELTNVSSFVSLLSGTNKRIVNISKTNF